MLTSDEPHIDNYLSSPGEQGLDDEIMWNLFHITWPCFILNDIFPGMRFPTPGEQVSSPGEQGLDDEIRLNLLYITETYFNITDIFWGLSL